MLSERLSENKFIFLRAHSGGNLEAAYQISWDTDLQLQAVDITASQKSHGNEQIVDINQIPQQKIRSLLL